MSDFLEVDFCKQRNLKFNRRFNVSDGIESSQLAGATSLGCRFPVSHRNGAHVNGFILSRVNKQSGKGVANLLTSPDESSIFNPGPTAWLSAVPGVPIPGSVTSPFPANFASVTPLLFANGGQVQLSFQVIGLGGPIGLREFVLLPPDSREYLAPSSLPLHIAQWRFGTVSSSNILDSFRLQYVNIATVTGIRPVYVWTGVAGQGSTVETDQGNTQNFVGVGVAGTPPALSVYDAAVLTPPVDFATSTISATNGPDQTLRKFSYPVIGGLGNPDWGGTAAPSFTLGNTRPTLTLYAQGEFLDAQGLTVDVNGTALSFGSTTMPFEQYQNPNISDIPNGTPGITNFYQSATVTHGSPSVTTRLYGQPNRAAQMEIPLGATTLTFTVQTAGADTPPRVFTIGIPKAANQRAWFEAIITGWSRTV